MCSYRMCSLEWCSHVMMSLLLVSRFEFAVYFSGVGLVFRTEPTCCHQDASSTYWKGGEESEKEQEEGEGRRWCG